MHGEGDTLFDRVVIQETPQPAVKAMGYAWFAITLSHFPARHLWPNQAVQLWVGVGWFALSSLLVVVTLLLREKPRRREVRLRIDANRIAVDGVVIAQTQSVHGSYPRTIEYCQRVTLSTGRRVGPFLLATKGITFLIREAADLELFLEVLPCYRRYRAGNRA